MNYSKNDVSTDLARAAHLGTSFVPEKRADQEQEEYAQHMESVANMLEQYRTEENSSYIEEDFERYRQGYLKRYNALLQAKSRVMSSMIAGPANFPAERNRKRCDVEHRRLVELLEWREKMQRKLEAKYNPDSNAPISSDDPNAIEKLQAKIDSLESKQQQMKEVNSVVRKKGKSDREKVELLLEMGIKHDDIVDAMKEPVFSWEKRGYPSFALRNNNAKIKGAKARLERLQQQQSSVTNERVINGIKIVDNVEENRIQLFFPGKPEEDFRRNILRHNGFVWSRKNQTWQRKRTNNAIYAAKLVAGEYS